MKIRAIGTGSAFCRHPLVTSSFLIQSEESNILVGCGPNIPAKLETINLSIDRIDMFIFLNSQTSHVGGLEEIIYRHKKKPFLVAPGRVLESIRDKNSHLTLNKSFEVRSINKVTINEEHTSETVSFIKNYLGTDQASYSMFLEEARIFISGSTDTNDEFLHRYGMPADIVIHQGMTPLSFGVGSTLAHLQELPLYLQQRIWVYDYGNDHTEIGEILPMLFLPQGTCIYDSDRKDKLLDKERFIREDSKRQVGNFSAS